MAEDSSDVLLDVRDLRTYFHTDAGVARAVDGVSFQIKRGECVALVGESGCGKSVTSMTVMRLVPMPPARIASGEILFDGQDLVGLSDEEMCAVRGKSIAMIFQEPQSALNPVFTVGDQITEAFLAHHPEARFKEGWNRAIETMKQVGIPDSERRASDYPHQLSGGMKQRICIAMALICDPQLIIADEPTTALDVTIQAQILELLRKLQKDRGLSLLLITHDLGIVAEMAARTFVMYAGKIVEKGPTEQIFKRPLHPYTLGLMRARPHAMAATESERQRLMVIPGMVPAATKFGDDCRFRPRCPAAAAVCAKEPPLKEVDCAQFAACHFPQGVAVNVWKQKEQESGVLMAADDSSPKTEKGAAQ
jgi:oligopeptide/dipeptide ABC transporter ATP-binding protein